MKQKTLPLAERLLAKLRKLGLPERKAKQLAKDLAPTAARAKVSGTVTSKLEDRLIKLGLSETKAHELAKGIAPIVRASIKAKAKTKALKLAEVDDDLVNQTVDEGIDVTDDTELDKVAPRVNGHRVRTDLPVAPMVGIKGIELLRVMDGLTSTATYLVAAVRKDKGIVAVRKLGANYYNMKFYPDMAYWKREPHQLALLGATDPLQREWYERMHMTEAVMEQVLKSLEKDAKPFARIKAVMGRFTTVGSRTLVKAFGYLRVSQAA